MSFLGCSQTNTPQVRMLKITVAPKHCHRPYTRDRDNVTTNIRAQSRIIRYLDKAKTGKEVQQAGEPISQKKKKKKIESTKWGTNLRITNIFRKMIEDVTFNKQDKVAN